MKLRAYNEKTKGMIYSDDTTSDRLEEKMVDFWTGMQLGVDIAGAKLEYMYAVGGSSGVDAKGKEVYAGDIIRAYRRDDAAKKNPVYSEVTYLNGCFMAFNCTWHELFRLWQSDWEIVGDKFSFTIPTKEINEAFK